MTDTSSEPNAPVPPPEDFTARSLPLTDLAPSAWSRVHRAVFDPGYYSESEGNRFSSAGVGVLYLADRPLTAFWEIHWQDLGGRQHGERRLSRVKLRQRVARAASIKRALRVFDADDARTLEAAGAAAATFCGDFANAQRWARELFQHPSRPDGILYSPARAGGRCLALFHGRADARDIGFGVATEIESSPEIMAALVDERVELLAD